MTGRPPRWRHRERRRRPSIRVRVGVDVVQPGDDGMRDIQPTVVDDEGVVASGDPAHQRG
ncbi:hypothetical protein J2853_000198 [Streptosporangium lutulentum]|uniref:Uncharacterized protein n=1 Tax=Streptosporangium lutulentum TaxID=1461250 RepID=A0ABT9Q2M9_9ACTN|nr:hypothetical protein [Streptosporangium lutulentum]MDP9840987.1 hypothetical protein [Streptosporangium lutulentum]